MTSFLFGYKKLLSVYTLSVHLVCKTHIIITVSYSRSYEGISVCKCVLKLIAVNELIAYVAGLTTHGCNKSVDSS